MSHDKNSLHISHYDGTHPWRSAIEPSDRSWLLVVDVTGAPHLSLATEAKEEDGHTVTTFTPCSRAMLRGAPGLLAGVAAALTLKIDVVTAAPGSVHKYIATAGTCAGGGVTVRDAAIDLLGRIDHADWMRRGKADQPEDGPRLACGACKGDEGEGHTCEDGPESERGVGVAVLAL